VKGNEGEKIKTDVADDILIKIFEESSPLLLVSKVLHKLLSPKSVFVYIAAQVLVLRKNFQV